MSSRTFACIALTLVVACDGTTGGPDDAATGVDGATDRDGGGACTSAADCDDGLFCNGTERCAPGTAGANGEGCVAGDAPCAAGEDCDETGDACSSTCPDPDADGDGHESVACGGDDCDDADATRYPGNVETCDDDDEDCDDTTVGADGDGDGFPSVTCCNGTGSCGADCDDSKADVSPSSTESCNAGIDDDCDGLADAADGVCVPCGPGYTGFDADCVDVDECAEGIAACTQIPPATCTNTPGAFLCVCPAGYSGEGRGGGGCVDIDECAGGLDDCSDAPEACENTGGTFTCVCPAGFVGTGRGAGGCRWNDPSLVSLALGAGATLSPMFSPSTTTYVLTLPAGTMSTTLTPTVAEPARTTITLAGSSVASGASALAALAGSAFGRDLDIVVTTETAASRTYTIAIRRGTTYVKASNTGAMDTFGQVVSLSADGMRLAVGAPYENSSSAGINGDESNNSLSGSGAVYVFARSGTTWVQEAYIKASNPGPGDYFGTSLAFSADGTRLAVGAPNEDSRATGVGGDQADNGASFSGAVYVFSRSGTSWTQEAYVKASNTNAEDHFGQTVSLSGDGTRLAVGTSDEDSVARGINGDQADNSVLAAGAVYVFARSGTSWTQEAYVKASNTGSTYDRFGISVALSGDGARLAVGAFGEDSSARGIGGDQADESGLDSGAVYVFSRSGTSWTQEAYVKASNTDLLDMFGGALALSSDGMRLAVGAYGEDSRAAGIDGDQADETLANSGAVYVFSRSGTTWTQEAYVKASNPGNGDRFGEALSLSADGTRLVVGVGGEDSDATGIDGDQTNNRAFDSGAVYVFSHLSATWTQTAYVKASNTDDGDHFGGSVSCSATTLAVGAWYESSSASGVGGDQNNEDAIYSGAAYVY